MNEKIRLNKYLAHAGICSRREADRFIADGLIKVNGEVITEMGCKVDPDEDKIELDNKIREIEEEKLYFAMNKPVGYTTVSKKQSPNEDIVMDLMLDEKRVYPVGRLDKNSEGLLLFTNDGVFAYRMTHPSFECEKEYLVTVNGSITKGAMEKLEKGVKLSGEKTNTTVVRKVSKNKLFITLTEGKNRQIRRICEKVGYPVTRLVRVRIGSLELGSIQKGTYRKLREREVRKLMSNDKAQMFNEIQNDVID